MSPHGFPIVRTKVTEPRLSPWSLFLKQTVMKARVKSGHGCTKDMSHLACHDFPKDRALPFDSAPGTASMLESPEGSLESETL